MLPALTEHLMSSPKGSRRAASPATEAKIFRPSNAADAASKAQSPLRGRPSPSDQVVAQFEARIAKYEADLAFARAQLRDARESAATAAHDASSQHRSAVVALEVRIAARDLAHGREVEALKTAHASATTSRVKTIDTEWSQRWELREAQFRKCVFFRFLFQISRRGCGVR